MRVIQLLILVLMIVGVRAPAADQPNVIIVLADDLGYDVFGCNGNAYAQTPHIDQLARHGLVFDRLYGTVSQCAPIRAELYTGLFPHHNGVRANLVKKGNPETKSIVDYLAPLGYRVGLTGKLHFTLGSPFELIAGLPSEAGSSDDSFSLTGVQEFIAEAQAGQQAFPYPTDDDRALNR